MAMKVSKKKVTTISDSEEKNEIKNKTTAKKTKTKTRKKTTKTSDAKKMKSVEETKEIKTEVNNYPNAYIVIDHPIDMETIYGNHYAIRVGASTDGYVEISFNNGEWQPCRYDAGYWWFDWTYFAKDDYFIVVRLMDPGGNLIMETAPRKCRIC